MKHVQTFTHAVAEVIATAPWEMFFIFAVSAFCFFGFIGQVS